MASGTNLVTGGSEQHHPTIAREMRMLNRSLELAEQAVQSVGSLKPSECNVFLAAGRLYQGASRQGLANRLSAGRLAMQEAKLIEEQKQSAA